MNGVLAAACVTALASVLAARVAWRLVLPRVVRRHATAFARDIALTIEERVVTPAGGLSGLVAALDPGVVAAHVAVVMEPRLRAYTEEVMFYGHPGLWRLLPDRAKETVHARVRATFPGLVRAVLDEFGRAAPELVDARGMIAARFGRDPELIVRLLRTVADGRAIGWPVAAACAGLVLGAAWGAGAPWIAAALAATPGLGWLAGPPAWLVAHGLSGALACVAAAGAGWLIAGWAGRALATAVPRGRLASRHAARVATIAHLLAGEILTVQEIAYALFYGPNAAAAREIVSRHLQPIVDEVAATYGPVAVLAAGSRLDVLRTAVGAKAVAVSTDPFDHWGFNRARAAVVEALLEGPLARTTAATFAGWTRGLARRGAVRAVALCAPAGAAAGVLVALLR